MFWLGIQNILLVFSTLWLLVSSDIYKSVMWTTNNPLFSDSGKLSPCFGKDLEMRVHLQSSLPIVCPFDFIIMKTLPSKPATGVLYENFWIVYDNSSFLNCDIDMTYNVNGDRNKKLLECNSPEALKSFTYSIDFKAKTHANSGIAFEGGKYYYFLATSDGTDGSLNNTRGGHCNDPKVRMKFKVYICRTDVVDEKCQNVSIGEFLCPSDLAAATTSPPILKSTATTTSPSTLKSTTTTATTYPLTIKSTTTTTTTSRPTLKSTTTTTTPLTIKSTATTTTTTASRPIIISTTATTKSNNSNVDAKRSIGGASLQSKDVLKELSAWKKLAIVSTCLLVALVIANLIACCTKRCQGKLCLRFTPMNKVTLSKKSGLQSPESCDNLNKKNKGHTDDGGEGKTHCQLSSFKPNTCITPAGNTQIQKQNTTQDMDPEKPNQAWTEDKTENGEERK